MLDKYTQRMYHILDILRKWYANLSPQPFNSLVIENPVYSCTYTWAMHAVPQEGYKWICFGIGLADRKIWRRVAFSFVSLAGLPYYLAWSPGRFLLSVVKSSDCRWTGPAFQRLVSRVLQLHISIPSDNSNGLMVGTDAADLWADSAPQLCPATFISVIMHLISVF